jgi:hypothetical protein
MSPWTTWPLGAIPTRPATTTISPLGATIPWEYIPSGVPNSFGVTALGIVP